MGDVDTSVVRLFTARIETGEFDSESQVPWVAAARARLGGTTWVSNNSNNAITETADRLAQAQRRGRPEHRAAEELGPHHGQRRSGAQVLPLKVPSSGPYKVAVMGYFANPSGGLFLGGYSSIQGTAGQAKEVNAYQGDQGGRPGDRP